MSPSPQSVPSAVPRASVHMTANHVIDFDDADHARGIVYCHDELERPLVAEFYQRCFNAELPESAVNVALS